MVSPLFTAFALIASGQAKVPPAPADLAPPSEYRATAPERTPRPRRQG